MTDAAALASSPATISARPAQLSLVGAEDRAQVLARRFGPAPLRFAEATLGLAASAAAEAGVDLRAALRAAGWSLSGADGRWRLPGHRGGRSLVEALGAELARVMRTDLAWWEALSPSTRDTYILRAFGARCRVDACAAPDLAAAMLRLHAARFARPERACPPASEARRKLEALARRGLPPAEAPRAYAPPVSPSYLRAFGTARE